jgi:hypothetical protein
MEYIQRHVDEVEVCLLIARNSQEYYHVRIICVVISHNILMSEYQPAFLNVSEVQANLTSKSIMTKSNYKSGS